MDSTPEHDIRLASDAQLARVAEILGSAFTNDPVLGWMCGDPATYAAFFRCEAEAHYRHHGQIYINGAETGGAMWLPAGAPLESGFHWRLLEVFWKLFSSRGLEGMKRGGLIQKIMSKHHPTEPHFYLRSIGAALEGQGRGIGSALITKGLEACDVQGMPAYLESSNRKNNPLYQRHGFEIVGEATLPDDGPTVWFMYREPRKGS